jgi:hypothetical protein
MGTPSAQARFARPSQASCQKCTPSLEAGSNRDAMSLLTSSVCHRVRKSAEISVDHSL